MIRNHRRSLCRTYSVTCCLASSYVKNDLSLSYGRFAQDRILIFYTESPEHSDTPPPHMQRVATRTYTNAQCSQELDCIHRDAVLSRLSLDTPLIPKRLCLFTASIALYSLVGERSNKLQHAKRMYRISERMSVMRLLFPVFNAMRLTALYNNTRKFCMATSFSVQRPRGLIEGLWHICSALVAQGCVIQ